MSEALINDLHQFGILFLKEVVIPNGYNASSQDWKSPEALKLQGENVEEIIKWSKNIETDEYTTKLGYSSRVEELQSKEILW